MSDSSGTDPKVSDPFSHFKNLTRKLVAVPKREVDKKEAAYQRRKRRKKKS